MEHTNDLTNNLLIAMPGLEDPNFSHTLTYICEHNEAGAMGIIVNRPSELQLGDILNHMEIPISDHHSDDQIIYIGGPVQEERGFVIHTHTHVWDSTLEVTNEISVTTSRDVLEAIAT